MKIYTVIHSHRFGTTVLAYKTREKAVKAMDARFQESCEEFGLNASDDGAMEALADRGEAFDLEETELEE
jgi:hypothetical protein